MLRSRIAICAAIAGGALSTLLPLAGTPAPAQAAEMKLLAPFSLRVMLPDLLPQFEQASGHKVAVEYATLGASTQRVMNGDPADVAIVSPKQSEQLQEQGKLLAGSGIEVARVGITVFVKNGAPKPELDSVDALKRTLLTAKSIAMGDPAAGGGSGVYLAGLMQRLGLAAEIKSKTKLLKSGTEVAEAVAKGETEIGIGVASDAKIIPGLDAIPLPPEVQSYSAYVAGVSASSKDAPAGKALIAFLTSPPVKQAFTANGFDVR